MKLKAKITWEWEYEANPKHYGTNDPEEAAEIDIMGAGGDIYLFLDSCPNEPKIDIQPV